jgi:CO/xanthine dehydrogenase Mo-binding subunit
VSNVGSYNAAFAAAAKTLSASFYASDRGHNPIGPGCAIADWTPGTGGGADSVTVYSNTQNVEQCAQDLATTFGLPLSNVRVVFYEGSSSFGNGWHAFDIAEAAALMAREVGKPVRLQLMRWDEQGWTRYGQAFLTDLQGGVDGDGNIVAYQATQFTQPSTSLFATGQLAFGLKPPALGSGAPNTENLAPFYKVAISTTGSGYQVVGKTITQPLGIFQSGTLRAPSGPQTAFASEQFVDMLAELAGMDPLAFRLQNLRTDGQFPRWATVLQTAAAKSGYKPHVAASIPQTGRMVTGWGLAIGTHNASYAGTVAKVQVDKKTGKVSVQDLWAAQDSGMTVNPGLIENQMSGNLIQGTSVALHEALRYDKHRVTSTDWVSYPILRFKDAPRVHTYVVQRTDQPSTGSGEPPHVPVVPAIANAIYDATGVRMWRQPMTPSYVKDRLAEV